MTAPLPPVAWAEACDMGGCRVWNPDVTRESLVHAVVSRGQNLEWLVGSVEAGLE